MEKEVTELGIETFEVEPARSLERETLRDDVLELFVSWQLHIQQAEGRGGLHTFLCTAAPRYVSIIAHLRGRHRTILQRIDALRRMIADGDARLLLAEHDAIVLAIAQHDELESELLADALESP